LLAGSHTGDSERSRLSGRSSAAIASSSTERDHNRAAENHQDTKDTKETFFEAASAPLRLMPLVPWWFAFFFQFDR
jgi:hypothetical protein